jgi:integrase
MGTILVRRRKHGGDAYMATIILKRDRKIVHRETRTFETHRRAKDWIRDREAELAKPGAMEAAGDRSATLGDAIDKYTEDSRKKIGRTKEQVLATIRSHPIAAKRCDKLLSGDIVEYAKELLADRQPQTVANYMSHLQAVFVVAHPAWGIPLDLAQMKAAHVVMRRLGITSKSKHRERRPTLDELEKVMRHFETRSIRSPKAAPMTRIIAFSIFATRRQEEITQIRWADLDEQHSRILVRDMKHPGEKIGNDTWCDLTPEALAIIKATPKTHAEIFPYGTDAISSSFTRACQLLGIEDLHFHDLRHDGISRLFELGWNIPHVATVSGHRSWQSLKRYTHIRQTGDKYAGWKWLDAVTKKPGH